MPVHWWPDPDEVRSVIQSDGPWPAPIPSTATTPWWLPWDATVMENSLLVTTSSHGARAVSGSTSVEEAAAALAIP